MLLLEEKIQKMEQKNLGEMVFAAEVGLTFDGDADSYWWCLLSIQLLTFQRLTKKRLKAGRKEVRQFQIPQFQTFQICLVPNVTLFEVDKLNPYI